MGHSRPAAAGAHAPRRPSGGAPASARTGPACRRSMARAPRDRRSRRVAAPPLAPRNAGSNSGASSNGGSRNTRSMLAGANCASAATPSPRPIVTASACRRCLTAASCSTSARSCSTSNTSRAPRDAASKPSAPVPANASTQCQPLRSCPSQLKSVSRTRSGVGRNPGCAGDRQAAALPHAADDAQGMAGPVDASPRRVGLDAVVRVDGFGCSCARA